MDINQNITGALNVAPVKLSGNYKIVVTSSLELYLDDYNGRRYKLDKNQQFLPQVANFLSTQFVISDINTIQYGGFNHGSQKAYHVPLYISDELPKYFVLNRVGNKFTNIDQPNKLYETANLLHMVDLEKIGLHRIFREINELFDYPVFFNLDDSYIECYGYGIDELTVISNKFSISNNISNQYYIDVLNNNILNSFVDRGMIYPKFINIEFEFVDDSKSYNLNNYFGFIGNSTIIPTEDEFDPKNINVRLYDYTKHITYEQTGKWLPHIQFDNLLYTKAVVRPELINAQIRYSINNITPGDYYEIYHPDGSLFYEYIVSNDDIRFSLRESLSTICKRATRGSNNQFEFKLDIKYISNNNTNSELYYITVINNINDSLAEEYTVKHSKVFKPINEDKFKSIRQTDIIITSDVIADKLKISNIKYNIIDKFKINDNIILRLDNMPVFDEKTTVAEFFEIKDTVNISLKPTNYLSVNDDLQVKLQYDKQSYINELRKRFIDGNNQTTEEEQEQYKAAVEAIKSFEAINNFSDVYPYVHDVVDPKAKIEGTTHTLVTDKVIQDTSVNRHNILNMMFASIGFNAYINKNILNIEKKFWNNNGCIDFLAVDKDPIKFHWFLIKAETPEYLKNDVRGLRYFTDVPKITSKLVDIGKFTETIFLGVKYRLHKKYADYDFCVYLDFNNDLYLDSNFHVTIKNKTIMVVINKYLDFVDLIRGGNNFNKPLIDLSFFYCVNEPHNSLSNNLISFKTGGIIMCDDKIPVMFEQEVLTDWKFKKNGKWYICLKRSNSVITDKFTDLFPEANNAEFYIYSTAEIDGQMYNYLSVKITLKGIYLLNDDYVWCEDMDMEFFDIKRMIVNDFVNNEHILRKVLYEDIIEIKPHKRTTTKKYGDYHADMTVLLSSGLTKYKILNTENKFSLKQYYFEVWHQTEFHGNVDKHTNGFFVFDEYISTGKSFDAISKGFDIKWDKQTPYEKFSLFDRNQMWLLLKSLLETKVNFKHNTPQQTRKIINDLLVNNLSEFSRYSLLPIKDSSDLHDRFMKLEVVENDVNGVIWPHYSDIGSAKPNNKVTKINRYRAPFYPALKALPCELKFQNDKLSENNQTLISGYSETMEPLIINEYMGNVVSSLFPKMDDIVIITDKTQDNIYDIHKLLIAHIPIEQMINVSDPELQNEIIKNNINGDIQYDFVNKLLDKYYFLETVYNQLNVRIRFDEYISNNLIITEHDDKILLGDSPKVRLIFKRK